jgi:hypothetical protein
MIYLGTKAIAHFSIATDAERSTDGQHHGVNHYRRRQTLCERGFGDIAPRRAGLCIESKVVRATNVDVPSYPP